MTVRDKTGLASQIADLLADNNTGDISEADIRSVATDIVESMALDTSVPDVDDLVESVTLSGTTVTVTKQDGTTSTFETPDSVAANRLVPAGGTDGQVLTKESDDDYDAEWEDPDEGVSLADQNRLNAVPGLEAKTADLSIEETGRTWTAVAAVADGGFATHANANTLSSAQAEALTYSASRNATGADAGRFFTLLRIPSGEDVRDFRVVQTGDLGTFTITGWHTIGTTTGGFTYAYSAAQPVRGLCRHGGAGNLHHHNPLPGRGGRRERGRGRLRVRDATWARATRTFRRRSPPLTG